MNSSVNREKMNYWSAIKASGNKKTCCTCCSPFVRKGRSIKNSKKKTLRTFRKG